MTTAGGHTKVLLAAAAIITGLCIHGCNRKPTKVDIYDVVAGNWRWIYSYGGYGGQYIDPDSVGYNKSVYFGINHVYTEFVDDSVAVESPFAIELRQFGGQSAYVLTIENQTIDLIIEKVNSDTLVLDEYCNDCYAHTYLRLYPI